MRDFQEVDFDGLWLPVHKYPLETDLLKVFPILFTHRDIFGLSLSGYNIKKDNALRWMVYMFDANSPLNSVDNVSARKMYAARMAGFITDSNGEFSEEVTRMLNFEIEEVNFMCLKYSILQADEEWESLIIYQMALHAQNSKLMSGGSDDEKVKDIIGTTVTLRKEISELKASLTRKNREKSLEKSLYQMVEARALGLRPEDYAMKYSAHQYKGMVDIVNNNKTTSQVPQFVEPRVFDGSARLPDSAYTKDGMNAPYESE